MHFSRALVAVAASLSSLLPSASAQCLNQVAAFNPNLRTMSSNSTWFIVPVPKAAAQRAVDASFPGYGLSLLDVPNDPSLFPQGFPAGQHPVLVSSGRTDDIRISALQIDGALIVGTIYITYVSKNGSPTPLAAQANQYLAGERGPLPNGLVPAVASPLLFAGNVVRLGQFVPTADAYQSDGAGIFSSKVAWVILPNPLSGPGVYPEAFDATFRTTASPRSSTVKAFKTLVNQPIILPSRLCQRNTYYFNNATALPVLRNGNITLGPGASGVNPLNSALQQASPDGSGVYYNVDGYSACAQNVGNNPEDCDQAGKTVDPASLQ